MGFGGRVRGDVYPGFLVVIWREMCICIGYGTALWQAKLLTLASTHLVYTYHRSVDMVVGFRIYGAETRGRDIRGLERAFPVMIWMHMPSFTFSDSR